MPPNAVLKRLPFLTSNLTYFRYLQQEHTNAVGYLIWPMLLVCPIIAAATSCPAAMQAECQRSASPVCVIYRFPEVELLPQRERAIFPYLSMNLVLGVHNASVTDISVTDSVVLCHIASV
jgi:hypothetical protein